MKFHKNTLWNTSCMGQQKTFCCTSGILVVRKRGTLRVTTRNKLSTINIYCGGTGKRACCAKLVTAGFKMLTHCKTIHVSLCSICEVQPFVKMVTDLTLKSQTCIDWNNLKWGVFHNKHHISVFNRAVWLWKYNCTHLYNLLIWYG